MTGPSIDFRTCEPVNGLWPLMVERLGLETAQRAVLQALDLQRMSGHGGTLPVLFCETCGLALASTDSLRKQTGLNAHGERMVLLYSSRSQEVQLLQHA